MPSINQYHNSMFAGEVIHQAWINDCAKYLQSIFGDQIGGKTIIDYGFGRGNWSLAFIQLGAKQVISVEASQSAAAKFKQHVEAHNISNVSVYLANADEQELHFDADIVFLYGIFHHVKYPQRLLQSARSWLKDDQGQVLIYAYDAGSLREILVSGCRNLLADRVLKDSWALTLHPHARHRAVDDLVAPIVHFWTANALVETAKNVDLACVGQSKDFASFQAKSLAPEFDPYVLLFQKSEAGVQSITPDENAHKYTDEYRAIEDVLNLIVQNALTEAKENIAIGLFNSWFAGAHQASFEDKLFYLWRYLCHAVGTLPQETIANNLSTELSVLIGATHRTDHPRADEFAGHCKMLKSKIKQSTFRI